MSADLTLVSAHAFLWIDTPQYAMVFDLSDETQSRALLDEVRNLIDGMVSASDPLTADAPPYATIYMRPMLVGYVGTLPEHEGW